jgi:hypothetical protein
MRREMERELKSLRMRQPIFQEMEQEAARHAPQQPQAPTSQMQAPAPLQAEPEVQARRLCNRSGHVIAIYDGDEKLVDVPSGWAVQLPPDIYLTARTDACELQGTEDGADINVTCR